MDLEEIYNLYFKDVYKYILGITRNKETAEDITQETFLKAINNINSFDGSKDIRAWLFTIAKNSYFTLYKKEKRYSNNKEIESKSADFDLLNTVITDELSMLIHIELHAMKEPYKEVFMLRFFGGLSYEKIASIFSKSEAWARVTYYRAKKEIQLKLGGKENE